MVERPAVDPAAALLGFAIAAIFAGVLHLPRSIYLIPYVALVSLFLYVFLCSSGLSLTELSRYNWVWGVVGAILVGAFVVRNVFPAEQAYWQMLLALYQLLGKQTEFEDLAIDFAVTFELSPPSWENVQAAQEVAAPAIEIPKDAFPLKGVISEASQDQIAKLMRYAESHAEVVVNCSAVNRVDYAYVGNLIGQLMQLLGNGKAVTLQGQNALVNELFRAMGIHQLANLVPAKLV